MHAVAHLGLSWVQWLQSHVSCFSGRLAVSTCTCYDQTLWQQRVTVATCTDLQAGCTPSLGVASLTTTSMCLTAMVGCGTTPTAVLTVVQCPGSRAGKGAALAVHCTVLGCLVACAGNGAALAAHCCVLIRHSAIPRSVITLTGGCCRALPVSVGHAATLIPARPAVLLLLGRHVALLEFAGDATGACCCSGSCGRAATLASGARAAALCPAWHAAALIPAGHVVPAGRAALA